MSKTLPRLALRILSALLSFAVLIQFFIAGMAAMTKPEWWTYHSTWVGIFQWLVLPLPILAFLGGEPRLWRAVLASIPMLQIALQYVLAHRALEGRLPTGIGLHAVNGALLLVVATFLAIGVADRKMSA
jgi:Family of unknown function (DUF6220)